MKLEQLNVRDARVQEFLWQHLVPTDFRHDFTKLDAMRYVEQQCYEGVCQLWGDMDVGFAFRATVRNPKVLEPHIMGKGVFLRSAIQQGEAIAWGLGYEKIVIWTQHDKIADIAEKLGFERYGPLPRVHLGSDGELQDLWMLAREKRHA